MQGEMINLIENPIDYDNYVYAVCKCVPQPWVVRVPLEEDKTSYYFNCPKCNLSLGVSTRSKKQRKEFKDKYEI